MAKVLQHRRDTTANLASVSGAIGEFFMDTTKNTLVVMDGSTSGGHALQLELVSGTNIKTVNGTSLLGSGDITIAGGGGLTYTLEVGASPGPTGIGANITLKDSTNLVDSITLQAGSGISIIRANENNITISANPDFSAVGEDVLPSFDAVYDLGSSTNQWYDLFVSNSVTIDGGSLSGNATGLVTDTMLIGDLLVTTNTITPDASTALQYNGDQGVVDILGNLDVSTGDWLLPAVVETADTEQQIDKAVSFVTSFNDGEDYLQYNSGAASGNVNLISISGFTTEAAARAFWQQIKPSLATQGKITLSFTGSQPWSYSYTGADVAFNNPSGWWQVEIYINHILDGDLPSVNTGVIRTVNVAYIGLGPTAPLTTGTEGAIRYNKDNSKLQVYTDSWNNVVPLNTDNALVYDNRYDTNGYGAYQLPSTLTLESGKRYVLSTFNNNVTAYLPDNPTIGDSIEIRWMSMSQLTVTNPASGWSALNISNSAHLYTFVYVGLKDNGGDMLTWIWWNTGGQNGSIYKV